MRRQKIGERHLSEYAPVLSKHENVKIGEFINEVVRFSGDYLRGIAEFEEIPRLDGYVSLCPEHTALILRLLAEDTPFGSLLKISVMTEDGYFILNARLDTEVDDEDIFRRAAAYASRAGFSATRRLGEITLRAKAMHSLVYSVYAKSRDRFYNTLVRIFFGL